MRLDVQTHNLKVSQSCRARTSVSDGPKAANRARLIACCWLRRWSSRSLSRNIPGIHAGNCAVHKYTKSQSGVQNRTNGGESDRHPDSVMTLVLFISLSTSKSWYPASYPEVEAISRIGRAATRRMMASSLGKMRQTSVRRLIAPFNRSIGLVEQILAQCYAIADPRRHLSSGFRNSGSR